MPDRGRLATSIGSPQQPPPPTRHPDHTHEDRSEEPRTLSTRCGSRRTCRALHAGDPTRRTGATSPIRCSGRAVRWTAPSDGDPHVIRRPAPTPACVPFAMSHSQATPSPARSRPAWTSCSPTNLRTTVCPFVARRSIVPRRTTRPAARATLASPSLPDLPRDLLERPVRGNVLWPRSPRFPSRSGPRRYGRSAPDPTGAVRRRTTHAAGNVQSVPSGGR